MDYDIAVAHVIVNDDEEYLFISQGGKSIERDTLVAHDFYVGMQSALPPFVGGKKIDEKMSAFVLNVQRRSSNQYGGTLTLWRTTSSNIMCLRMPRLASHLPQPYNFINGLTRHPPIWNIETIGFNFATLYCYTNKKTS